MLRYLFIVNPKAGHGGAAVKAVPEIEKLCKECSYDYEVVYTAHAGHAEEIVRSLPDSCDYRVFACGGDGTLNEVSAGALGKKNVTVSHIPCGTGNDYIRLFGEDSARFFNLDVIRRNDTVISDVIETEYRPCLNMCAMGIDSRAAAEMIRYRVLGIFGSKVPYNVGILLSIIKGINRRLRIEADGEVFEGKFALASVMNGRYYGGGFNPAPDALPDDGMLDLVIVKAVNIFTLIKLIDHYSKGDHEKIGDKLIYRRCKNISIKTRHPIYATFDGERIKLTSLTAKISDEKIRFLIPQNASWAKA